MILIAHLNSGFNIDFEMRIKISHVLFFRDHYYILKC
jgi:hypothetical protein